MDLSLTYRTGYINYEIIMTLHLQAVTIHTQNGNTVLILACMRGNHGLVRRILSNGANPKICNYVSIYSSMLFS